MEKERFIHKLQLLHTNMKKGVGYPIDPHPSDSHTATLTDTDVLRWIRVCNGEVANTTLIESVTMEYANQIWKQIK